MHRSVLLSGVADPTMAHGACEHDGLAMTHGVGATARSWWHCVAPSSAGENSTRVRATLTRYDHDADAVCSVRRCHGLSVAINSIVCTNKIIEMI